MRNLRYWLLGAACLLLVGAALIAAHTSPGGATMTLLKGSFGSARAISGTLRETTPLLMLGVAVFLALRAGLFNIGAEGQFLVGAMVTAAVTLKIGGPIGVGVGLVAGAIAGALWAWPAGAIRAYRGGHEVITTIMLNNVAIFLTRALVAGPLKDPGQSSPTTASLADGSKLPMIVDTGRFTLNPALLFGIVAVILLVRFFSRRVAGYELRAVGANARAAEFAGIDVKRLQVRAMMTSGAIAALAGGLQVLAYEHRFYSDFSPGYGFDALGVALLAGTSPLGLIPSALAFGALHQGSVALSLDGVPKSITTILLGLLIIVFGALRYRKQVMHG